MVTAVLILFILAAVAYPKLVQNKTQFHIAIVLTMLMILLRPLEFATFIRFVIAGLQVLTFVALVLCTEGINLEELGDRIFNAYDEVRHGEEHKPVIVPRTNEPANETVPPAAPTPPPPVNPPVNEPSIPLEPPPNPDEPQ